MEKMILKDNTEFEILEGAALNAITVETADYAGLQAISDALLKAENLDSVQFKTDDIVTGKYESLKLERPLFTVDVVEGKVQATFCLAEKTDVEKRLDAVEKSDGLQDGAIGDMAEQIAGILAGGN